MCARQLKTEKVGGKRRKKCDGGLLKSSPPLGGNLRRLNVRFVFSGGKKEELEFWEELAFHFLGEICGAR